jgi:hypothetical protein
MRDRYDLGPAIFDSHAAAYDEGGCAKPLADGCRDRFADRDHDAERPVIGEMPAAPAGASQCHASDLYHSPALEERKKAASEALFPHAGPPGTGKE